jgi:hypothetical protein
VYLLTVLWATLTDFRRDEECVDEYALSFSLSTLLQSENLLRKIEEETLPMTRLSRNVNAVTMSSVLADSKAVIKAAKYSISVCEPPWLLITSVTAANTAQICL